MEKVLVNAPCFKSIIIKWYVQHNENGVNTLRHSFENGDSTTINTVATKSMKNWPQNQEQYTHKQQEYSEKLYSYTPFQQQRKEQQPQLSLMKQNSWGMQEHINSYEVNGKQTAKSLESLNFREFGSQVKKNEPTRWSHNDVVLSTSLYSSAHQNVNNSSPHDNSQYIHKNANTHQNASKRAYYNVQHNHQQQLQEEMMQRSYSNNYAPPHSSHVYQQQQPVMQQKQPQRRQQQPAKQRSLQRRSRSRRRPVFHRRRKCQKF
jgi:hypothetical protein